MQITLHRQFPRDLQQEWDALLRNSSADVPFLRYECLHNWWQTRGGGEWQDAELTIVTAHRDGVLVGVAPLFLAHHAGRNCLLLLGSIEVYDYLDFIALPEDLAPFIDALCSFLAESDLQWEALDLYNIIDYSPTLLLLNEAAAKQGWALNTEQIQPSPYIPLPEDWESYLAGIKKKQRHEIRRKIRRFEELEVPKRWYIVEDEDTLESEMDAFLSLMAQEADKTDFLTDSMRAFMHQAARCFLNAGMLHLSFLELDEEKIAGKFLFHYRNRLWAYNSGVDRRFYEHSPGWVLLGYLLQWATENGIEEFDFMRGDEDYKYRFGAVDRFVMRATLSRE